MKIAPRLQDSSLHLEASCRHEDAQRLTFHLMKHRIVRLVNAVSPVHITCTTGHAATERTPTWMHMGREGKDALSMDALCTDIRYM